MRQHFKTIDGIKWNEIKEYSSFGRDCHVADKLLMCLQLTEEVVAVYTNLHIKKTVDTKGVLGKELEVSQLCGKLFPYHPGEALHVLPVVLGPGLGEHMLFV